MTHITSRLRGLMAAFVAVFAALTLVPGVALADGLAGTADLTVGPFEEKVQVDIYRVVEYTPDPTKGIYSWTFANGLNIEGYAGIDADSDEMKAAAGTMAAWAHQQEKATDTRTVEANSSAEFTDLEPGQYLILVTALGENSHTIYQNMVVDLKPVQDKATGNWEVSDATVNTIKSSDKPVIDKDITDADDDADTTDDYKVGDWVPFTISTLIPVYPNDQWGATTFKITDTMTKGLTAPAVSDSDHYYQVLIDGDDASGYLKSPISIKVDEGTGETTAVFEFDYATLANDGLIGKNVTITYSAQINDEVNVKEGSTDSNDATLEFGNSSKPESNTDHVDVETYAISILKTDADTTAKLQGAQFGVYTDAACSEASLVGTITTDIDGVGFIAGLKVGTYYVKEIAAPEGYQLDQTVHTVTVPDAGDDNNVNLNITNKSDLPGLPTTGGAGTVALTAGGVVLIAAAGAIIVRSRKQN